MPPQQAAERITIALEGGSNVHGLWLEGSQTQACFVLAHGAGAGMESPFLQQVAMELAASGISTLRYQFPYMDRGSKRPDRPEVCHATVRAAVAEAARRTAAPLFAGGRSFGGRMSSQAQSRQVLPGVRGLIFLAFPLHPANRPGDERAEHLYSLRIPMLFLQGTRDELAQHTLLEKVVREIGELATLLAFEQANHSFHVPARSGRNDAQILTAIVQGTARWIAGVVA